MRYHICASEEVQDNRNDFSCRLLRWNASEMLECNVPEMDPVHVVARFIQFCLPSWELTYPLKKAILKMMFLFPRGNMLVRWRVTNVKQVEGFDKTM